MSVATLAVLVSALAPLSASAAGITWGAATTVSADTDVVTSGSALYAYAGGLTTASTNLNGVTFTAGSGFAAWGNVTFGSTFAASVANSFAVAAAPFNSLSSAYQAVLQGGAYGNVTSVTVTLNGLTPGNDYSVQIWVNDSRSTFATRQENVTSTNGNTVTLAYNVYQALGGVGQFALGTFMAGSTNQTFTLTSIVGGPEVQLNAISVRDLGAGGRIWVGSSSTSWGTAANWSPASVPIAGDAITFNSSSTANLATLLDASYTVSTINLSNAPSAVSVGYDGNTLTINSGINLFGASQSLTISNSLVLGASQTWTVTNNGILAVNGGVSGSAALTIVGGGVVSFGGAATYSGKTTISSGKLVLSGSGSLSSPIVIVAGGATFDVSAASPNYALNGASFQNSSAGAVINGSSDFTSGTISLTYDGVNPPFVQTNGTLTVSSATVINVNNTGTVLGTGNHTIIASATTGNIGQVAVSDSLPSVSLTGNGAVGAVSLAINGSGGLDLVVGSADVWIGASDNSWANTGNWSGGVIPDIATNGLFNNLSTANLSTVLNVDFFLAGVTVLDPSGPVTIGGANNLGISAFGLNLSGASRDLTITAPVSVLADQVWNVTTNRSLNLNGGVSGSAAVTVAGAGTVNFNSASTYAGNTTVSSNSTLKMVAANVMPNGPGTGNLNVNGVFDLNGYSEGIGGLLGAGIVDNTGVGAVTLTVCSNDPSTFFNGTIKNTGGSLALVVNSTSGTGVLGLNAGGTNSYSGGTTVNSGIVYAYNNSSFGSGPVVANPAGKVSTVASGLIITNALTLNGGTLEGFANSATWAGPVTVASNSAYTSHGGGLTLSGNVSLANGSMLAAQGTGLGGRT